LKEVVAVEIVKMVLVLTASADLLLAVVVVVANAAVVSVEGYHFHRW
jgi:hypothetical protein